MTKIMITGKGSFIGTNFLKLSKYRDIYEVSFRTNPPEEKDFLGFDVIVHLAAKVHQSRKSNASDFFLVNRDLTVRIADLAKKAGVKQLIFLSTVKVYGKWRPDSDPWTEDSPCYPDDPYGTSKYQAEIALDKMRSNDFTVSVIRTPIVYGPGVSANILKLIKLIETMRILPFMGINNNRHFTYVENLVGYIDRIIELRAPGVFIAMDNKALSTTGLIELISRFMRRKPVLFRLPEIFVRAGVSVMPDIFERLYRSFYLDNSKTRQILNYNPPFKIEEGIELMITSYLSGKK